VTAHFNLADRQAGPLLEAAAGGGPIFAPWQPVSLIVPGVATDTSGPAGLRRRIEPIVAAHQATVPQVALAWPLAQSPAVRPLPATTSIDHLRENLAAGDLVLTGDELRQLS
jgi:pyridoxine 4-dehydrogenase